MQAKVTGLQSNTVSDDWTIVKEKGKQPFRMQRKEGGFFGRIRQT
jgi:hypothetical protein